MLPSNIDAKKRVASACFRSGEGSKRGRRASMCLRARTAICRVFAGVFSIAAATSSLGQSGPDRAQRLAPLRELLLQPLPM